LSNNWFVQSAPESSKSGENALKQKESSRYKKKQFDFAMLPIMQFWYRPTEV